MNVLTHTQYTRNARAPLALASMLADPMQQFNAWFAEAQQADSGVREPEAMCLSTCGAGGGGEFPSSRMVLLKQTDERGFVFYSNYGSRKGAELAANPRASLCFYWKEHERSVRVVGHVERVARAQSVAYYRSRPRESQLGAWASLQSSPLAERAQLDDRMRALAGGDPAGPNTEDPPPHWGGYRVLPVEMEFWQGRANRLHDRVTYTRPAASNGEDKWERSLLFP